MNGPVFVKPVSRKELAENARARKKFMRSLPEKKALKRIIESFRLRSRSG
jgi:hypothetical protein